MTFKFSGTIQIGYSELLHVVEQLSTAVFLPYHSVVLRSIINSDHAGPSPEEWQGGLITYPDTQ